MLVFKNSEVTSSDGLGGIEGGREVGELIMAGSIRRLNLEKLVGNPFSSNGSSSSVNRV
jgi:hypothetical protein